MSGACPPVRLTLLATTDLHGRLLPVDYGAGGPRRGSLAQLATLIRAARAENPALLLLDGGDTLQGTPLTGCHQRGAGGAPEPMMRAMNALGYDAMAVGNHDYDFGRAALERARHEAAFPWLSANTCQAGTDESAFVPCLLKTVAGVRIGIVGLTTPAVPVWIPPEERAGLEFHDSVAAARHWVRRLREQEHADLVVVLAHLGCEADAASGHARAGQAPGENAALAIAREVEGIDVLLAGHTHETLPPRWIGDTLLLQAGKFGECLARIDVEFVRPDGNGWRKERLAGRLEPATEQTEADPEIIRLAAPYEQAAQAWLDRAIGTCVSELSATDAHRGDSALLKLVHCAQLEAGNAEVSLTASFNPAAHIPRGAATVRDIARLYPYDNTLVVVELTGRQLKEALEYAAGLLDRRGMDFPVHEFDTAAGVNYEIDPSRARGDRVVRLCRGRRRVKPDDRLRTAITSYRWGGGGGYTMFAEAPVLARSAATIRELIIDWVGRHGVIPDRPDDNWRLQPRRVSAPAEAGAGR